MDVFESFCTKDFFNWIELTKKNDSNTHKVLGVNIKIMSEFYEKFRLSPHAGKSLVMRYSGENEIATSE